jgi:hypothetical protein
MSTDVVPSQSTPVKAAPKSARRWSPRRTFAAACAAGGTPALVAYSWFVLKGSFNLFPRVAVGHFYEVQARSLLHGHWDVPWNSLFLERFNINGKFYMYQGPFPALLRMPVVAVTRELDGRMSSISMIIAFAVMLIFISRIAWQSRVLLRGDGPPTKGALVATAGFVFVSGCGSAALFTASTAWVYHEAIIWGVALSIASFSFLISYLVDPSVRALILASLTATAAVLSRGSVGFGPVAALVLVLVAQVASVATDGWRRRRGLPSASERSGPSWLDRLLGVGADAGHRPAWATTFAAGVPVALYAYVNYSKFGTLFGPPSVKDQDLLLSPAREAALAANDGNLFGLKFAPTIALQYLRPDAIRFDRLFPWVTFAPPARVIGGVTFEDRGFSASLPATATLLVVLAVVGMIAVLRAPRSGSAVAGLARLRVPLIGAVVGCLGSLSLAWILERYTGDFLPLLVLAGAVGLWRTAALMDRRSRRARATVGAVLAVLAVWSCWAMGGLTLLYQRAYAPLVTRVSRAQFIDFQMTVHELVPGGTPSRVGHGTRLPARPGPPNSLFVVGDCAGLYWSDGRAWLALEATPPTGLSRVRVVFGPAPSGTLQPVLTVTHGRRSSIIWVRRLSDREVQFEYEYRGPAPADPPSEVAAEVAVFGPSVSAPIRVVPSQPVDLTVRLDPGGYVSIQAGSRHILSTYATAVAAAPRLGNAGRPDLPPLTGTARFLPVPTPVCHRLVRIEH